MELVQIIECKASECAYNNDMQCHAKAITVGGETDHKCDTFCTSSTEGGFPDTIASVGACKAEACRFNSNLECSSPGITVGHESDMVDCLTFEEG